MRVRRRGGRSPGQRERGFTLIEVMIAVLVMAIGLLGMALLQTMNVRFTKSAQQRTVATILSYELFDMMRIQRADAGLYAYNGITFDSFADVDTSHACVRAVSADIAANIGRWKCEVSKALPDGAAQVRLEADGEVTLTVRWGDAHWMEQADQQQTTFVLKSRI